MATKIGFSVSMCVLDILKGEVKLEDVTCIIAGTCAPDGAAWLNVVSSYCQSYWRNYSFAECARIVDTLRISGRIVQPRLNGQAPHYLRDTGKIWLDV